MDNTECITEEKAMELAQQYLKEIYYNIEKMRFLGCETLSFEDNLTYRLQGIVNMKSRSLINRFIADKSANVYKFTIDINARSGQIVTYQFI
jgi:hypothetical protein